MVPNALMLAAAVALNVTLLAVAIVLALNGRPGRHAKPRPHRDAFRGTATTPPRRKRAAVIVNPTKFTTLTPVRSALGSVAAELDWDQPLILETTREDPGYGQARSALDAGVDLICSLGGDGTVRVVASVLAGTSTPMGLLPGGTGNLLARNLELPLTDIGEAFRVACAGRNRAVDVAYAALAPPPSPAPHPGEQEAGGQGAGDSTEATDAVAEHAFLVMAGVGLDATIMSETSEESKAKLGWTAYAATGLKNFLGTRIRADVSVDGGPARSVTASTVLIGNCGRITGGINLMPDARIDDGVLDVVVLSPKGFPGWVDVTARVLTQHRSNRTERLQRHTATEVVIATDKAQAVQLDGDVIGETTRLSARIVPKALLVRVAALGEPGPAG